MLQEKDILEAAGAETAHIVIVATGSPDTNIEITKMILKHFHI